MQGQLPITTVADLASSFLSNSVKMEDTMGKFSVVSAMQMNMLEIGMIFVQFHSENKTSSSYL